MSYRSFYPLVSKEPSEATVTHDCAIDWPDWNLDGADGPSPIHLDTCRVMTGDDTYCTCGLTILLANMARFL